MKEKISKLKAAFGRINAKRSENSEKYKMTNLLLTILFPLFIVCMAEINQGKYPSKFVLFLAQRPSVMLFNAVIASLIFYGLLLLFKKGWIAVTLQSVIYMALSITELFKFNTNGNHLIMTDMKLIKSVKSLTSFAYIKITPMLIAYVLIVLVYIGAVFWFNPKMKMRISRRIVPSVICMAACISVVTVPAVSGTVYSVFDIDQTTASNSFKLNEKFENNSFLAFFCQTASENLANRLQEPENYNDDTVAAMMDVKVDEDSENDFKKPNVIMIMSEAFADFRTFEDQLDMDSESFSAYDPYDRVASEGYRGTAIVPTFASWTVRTEFELNFGLPVRSLNDPNMPQRTILNRAQPTVASYYKDWGYSTAYVHPFLGYFYSRNRIYSNFGFDRLVFDEDFDVPINYYGTYIEDKTVFDQIEYMIRNTDEPLFLHTTTMQNHQPYDQGEDPEAEMDNYLQWIGHSCNDFEKFINNIKEIDEPTVVFMVGDHYPSLKGENSVYDQIGMNGDNCSVLYEQPYLIWSNCDLDYSEIPQENLSAFYMPYIIMDLIDTPRDSFIQAMMDKMETVPVYSTNYAPDIERDEELDILTYDRILGDIVSSNAIPEELRKTAEEAEE